jgi:hypothetical protein
MKYLYNWINQCYRNNLNQCKSKEYKQTKTLTDDTATLALFAEIYLQYLEHN